MDLPTLTTPATPPYEYSLPDHHHHQDEVSRLNSTSASPKIDQPSSNSYFETTSTMHPPVSAVDKSVVFQLNVNVHPSYNVTSETYPDTTSEVICGESLLSALRKRVAAARQQSNEEMAEKPRKKSTTGRRSTTGGHASSGRPSRVKGPCQACQETSDGCMRKAFNWPFPTSTIFNDKGKPFVYLCNKCGLRYNKSGGSVCRHCRWVFCKEEKRKAMQHIEQMRRSRPDGKVDPNEDIENFVCTPKYWTCGRPWKVGWVLNHHGEDDEDDEDMDMHSLSSDTMAVDTA
ncbi:uncharacterized protein BYT42DRAFT_596063 [Radiomyces spectabilis]|uniref:uncharacterized protein n=1 Tax=Radiomyces spectabilis TaxID=64574 RepID=UPI002220F26B|nr:uncharacterized protein BYT42DRAFT_596063 [Radiomyces spectabilis]KAI8365282.1 hypothetical protein BYT42DRAFT_596063 [Radiomyces spectabilis]